MTVATRASDPAADAALAERFRAYRRSGAIDERNALVADNLSIAEALARRFANRGEPLDDLEQVAMIGLVKAVERYDPDQGVPFAGYAVPTITGELRRHFRDATWALKVSRRAKDLHVRVPAAVDRLTAELGRPPTPDQLAEELDVTVDDVLDALDAAQAYRTTSTDTPEGSTAASHAVRRGGDQGGISIEDRVMLARLLDELPERERQIIHLRFFEDLSQSEIAERVGMSQVHVSRLLRRTLRALHEAHVEP